MENPWLHIPLDDYERHMALPQVAQARMLSDLFAAAVDQYRPRSVALLGCAGGNGLERLLTAPPARIVGVDVNPAYIEQARRRFGQRLPQLELCVGDLQTDEIAFAPVELAFAGLLFEYVEIDAVLIRIRALLVPGGRLVSVVQLPCAAIPEVTPSPYASLAALAPRMRLVTPDELRRLAAAQGLRQTAADTVEAAGGKHFCVQTFRLDA